MTPLQGTLGRTAQSGGHSAKKKERDQEEASREVGRWRKVWDLLALSPPIPALLVSSGQGAEERQNGEAAMEESGDRVGER